MVTAALKGDVKAQAALITLLRSLGMTGEPPEATNPEPYTVDDAALIADYFGRHQPEVQPTEVELDGATDPNRRAAS